MINFIEGFIIGIGKIITEDDFLQMINVPITE